MAILLLSHKFLFLFWYLRWLQVFAPTLNPIVWFPYQKMQYFKKLFDLSVTEFWRFQRSPPLNNNLLNLCFIYKFDYLPNGLNIW
jgi:hypothetical protein